MRNNDFELKAATSVFEKWLKDHDIPMFFRQHLDTVRTEDAETVWVTLPFSIGLASYKMDSHHCRWVVIDGRCVNQGDVEIPIRTILWKE